MGRVDDLVKGQVALIGDKDLAGVAALADAGDLLLKHAEGVREEGRETVDGVVGEDAGREAVKVRSTEIIKKEKSTMDKMDVESAFYV